MKKVLVSGIIAGIVLFVVSYGGLFLSIQFFPEFFVAYNNPLFNSNGSRDLLFYMHAFIIAFALSWFWDRFKGLLKGHSLVKAIEFAGVYALVALLPVMWITFSSLDITFVMVMSWFLYGFVQALLAGIVFTRLNP